MSVKEVIQKVEKLPEDLLQSASDYIDYLLVKAKKEVGTKKPSKRVLGKGKKVVTWISPDFDAPLEDMKDYM